MLALLATIGARAAGPPPITRFLEAASADDTFAAAHQQDIRPSLSCRLRVECPTPTTFCRFTACIPT
jgi:hypothetical protein